jgi:hypothetical protein
MSRFFIIMMALTVAFILWATFGPRFGGRR